LKWSERATTRAAQKIPLDAPEQIRRSFIRQAKAIRDYDIPDELRVNADQQQTRFQMGSDRTWAPCGDKQVASVGKEEKRAFTLMVAISACGEILAYQAIWDGVQARSLPNMTLEIAEAVKQLGFVFDLSKTTTYWSTEVTMENWVNLILVPYFQRKKKELGRPEDQECLLQIDVWSVHRSKEFRGFMSSTYPWIILDYVPGGCTGL
ncbi:hypothetical protein M422DRAFT_120251, partial [Sphaerobolus stellatus SS14]